MSQNDLLENLREGIEPSFMLGRELVGIRPVHGSWELRFKKAETSAATIEEANILVGADGISSAVRSLIGLPVKESTSGEYTYFSGIVNAGSGCPPFETLGQGCERSLFRSRGLRFACVPLGAEKCLWFSSLPSSIAPEDTGCSDGILRFLKDLHKDWHQPIPRLLERSLETGVDVLVEKLPFYVSPAEEPYVIAGDGAAAVLLGDSCHAVTPNLAQGAAVAIEDACDLAVCLKNHLEVSGLAPGLDQCLRSYVDSRRERCRSHAQMTAFTEALSQMNGVLTEPMRNMMAFVPRPLNSWIFDAALDRSMGNFRHQGAAHRLRRAIAAL